MNHRSCDDSGSPFLGAILAICIAAFGLAVLWQLGHEYVMDSGAPVGEDQPAAAFMTTADVNLRAGPGTGHEVLKVLPIKTRLTVIGDDQDGFAPVRVDGRQAWVSADYIAPEGSVLAATEHIAVSEMPTSEPTAIPTREAPAPPPETVARSTDAPVAPVSQSIAVDDLGPTSERWIEIDRGRKTVTLHDGESIVGVFDALIGKDPSPDGYYSTAIGTFHVFMKNRELTETPFAPGVYLTDFVGFDPARSNGIHSPVRDAEGNVVVTGGTTTLGCVRLGADDARTVFDFAEIGMRVEVHD